MTALTLAELMERGASGRSPSPKLPHSIQSIHSTQIPQSTQPAKTNSKPANTAIKLNLHGTGLTKKIAERAERAHAKQIEREQAAAPERTKFTIIDEVPPLVSKELGEALDGIDGIEQPKIVSLHKVKTIELDEAQQAALDGIKREKYACLIGAAGTGKTTLTIELAKALEKTVGTIDLNRGRVKHDSVPEYNVAICFCAFTGRAVQQMKRALPIEYHPMCNTIHATLGYMPDRQEYFDDKSGKWKEKLIFRPTFTAQNKLPYKVCVVDESGMVPIHLWNELIAALPEDCRIILIGDINQLPPVQGRSVLGFAMTQWPTFTLTKIHRQAMDNPIIANAHEVLAGRLPTIDPKKFMIKVIREGSVKAVEDITRLVKKLHAAKIFDPFRDALIVPQNVDLCGQEYLNDQLVHYFNPPQKDENDLIVNRRVTIRAGRNTKFFAIGDKVMLLQNDRERGLTNGMTGKVTDLRPNPAFSGVRDKFSTSHDTTDHGEEAFEGLGEALQAHATTIKVDVGPDDEDIEGDEQKESQRAASHIMMVQFDTGTGAQEIGIMTAGQFSKIALAYAFTCHKSQGGEYHTVVILVHSVNIRMLSREWLYTAITRAQERVIILCNNRGLAQAVRTQWIKGDTLEAKAAGFLALQDKADTSLPNLPEPVRVENKTMEELEAI